jgi:predicted methyltransferase
MSGDITKLIARIGDDPEAPVKTFLGREAWALAELVAAGTEGLTTLQRPAPRWSDYIAKLRKRGVGIITEHEPHGGAYSGHHGRYRLTVPVAVIESFSAGA